MQIRKLRRLVRVTNLLYRLEAAEVAKLQGERSSLLDSMESAAHRLDAEDVSAFDANLAIAWAAKRRQELVRADTLLEDRLKAAGSALASFKGAESRLSSEQDKLDRAAELSALEQIIENVVRRRSSFGQDAAYSLSSENDGLACSSSSGAEAGHPMLSPKPGPET